MEYNTNLSEDMIRVRVSKTEKDEFIKKAKKLNMKLSEYIRYLLRHDSIETEKDKKKVKVILDLDMIKNARDVFNLIRSYPRKTIKMSIPVGVVYDELSSTNVNLCFKKFDLSNDPYAIGLSINNYKSKNPEYNIGLRFRINFNYWDGSYKDRKYNRLTLVDYIFRRTEDYAEIDWYDEILENISDALRDNIKKYNNDKMEITTKGEKRWKEGKDNENDSNNYY